MLNKDELKSVMREDLLHCGGKKITITDDTIHNQVLSDTGGLPRLGSKGLYKLMIRQTLIVSGNPDKEWPSDWMGMSVDTLAGKLTT